MQINDCFFLGTIVKKHGLKGHIVLKLDTDEPQTYYKMESFWVEMHPNLIPFFIKEISVLQHDSLKILLDMSSFTSEDFIKKKVFLPLSQLPKLSGKKFYYHEVIGFSIKENEISVGKIVAINDNASYPYFIIKNEELKEFVIPLVKDWILEVNREEKFITMNLPEGILDL